MIYNFVVATNNTTKTGTTTNATNCVNSNAKFKVFIFLSFITPQNYMRWLVYFMTLNVIYQIKVIV